MFALQTVNWVWTGVSYLLLLLLSSGATYCHFFFSKVAPLFLDFSVSLYQTWIRPAFVMPSSCLRFLRRANFAPKVEARRIQNGMKKSSTLYKVRAERACSLCRAKQRHEVTSTIRLSDEPKQSPEGATDSRHHTECHPFGVRLYYHSYRGLLPCLCSVVPVGDLLIRHKPKDQFGFILLDCILFGLSLVLVWI